ncbi:MAG: polymerase sigma-E factor [Planctomycetota bacterium]
MSDNEEIDLLELVKHGDRTALGSLLENYRPYLLVLAQRYLDPRLQGRLDPADVVQVTFLEAQRDLDTFRGEDLSSMLAWLRNILRNNIHSMHQHHLTTKKRSARMEIGFHHAASDSQPGIGELIPSETTSPSQRAMKDEQVVELAESMLRLPPMQQEALRLRYMEGWSLKQIADKMQKSEMAVAGLLKRGLQGLREAMQNQSSAENETPEQ